MLSDSGPLPQVKFYKLFTTPHIIPLIDYSITRNGTIAEINLVLPYYKVLVIIRLYLTEMRK